jgi:hypothetical protein
MREIPVRLFGGLAVPNSIEQARHTFPRPNKIHSLPRGVKKKYPLHYDAVDFSTNV